MKKSKSFPWKNAMQFGLGILKLSPSQFWAMTPRELDAAYRANNLFNDFGGPVKRNRLDELMKRFPDRASNK
ncbi:MAG: phage tail assembly chaperone [Devosiaceae bacterium]|nr:phage tail assembly chaperone [Devosiaceae bacterium]